MRQKIFAPSQLLKVPSLIPLRQIIVKWNLKAKAGLRYLSNLANRFWAFVFFLFSTFFDLASVMAQEAIPMLPAPL